MRRQFILFFEKEYEVITVKDGVECLEFIDREVDAPDAIFLDVVMPRLDGLQTLKKIRENSALTALPILMISGTKDTEKVIESLKLGASDFIIKPLVQEMVAFRLHRVMSGLRKSR